jgi:hypothetical protein
MVCRLQLLLALDSAVILGSEFRGTQDHILLCQIRVSPNLDGQVFESLSTETGWPRYTPRHCVPFSSPPRTRRAMVEVFEPTSTSPKLRPTYKPSAQTNRIRSASSVACVSVEVAA